jgi:hypothetical protein
MFIKENTERMKKLVILGYKLIVSLSHCESFRCIGIFDFTVIAYVDFDTLFACCVDIMVLLRCFLTVLFISLYLGALTLMRPSYIGAVGD